MMIKAFKRILAEVPDAVLLIVGDGPSRAKLEDLVLKLEIDSHVLFTGFKVYPQQYLDIIDVFLLSSLSEGTSMTLLEAMALSKPCVVTDVGGNPEIVDHDETGFVTPSGDDKLFAEAALKLLNNSSLRKLMGTTARRLYLEKFTVNNMLQRYQTIYQKSNLNESS